MRHVPDPVLGQNSRSLHHHSIVEEANKNERDGKLHDAVKGLEEKDGVEPDWELQKERTDLEQVTHNNRNQEWTESLKHISHQAQPDMFVVRHTH